MRPHFTIFLLASLLAACDGGATNDGAGDTRTLAVGLIRPLADETNVATDTPVQAAFSEDVMSVSVDAGSFVLNRNTGAVAGAVRFDALANVASFAPAAPLALATTYTATLTRAVRDLAGNGLTADFDWSFTTRDGEFGAEAPVDTGAMGGSAPVAAVDGAGNLFAAFAAGGVWVHRYTPAGGWEGAVRIDDGSGTIGGEVRLAINDAGQGFAVWSQGEAPVFSIWASRYSAPSGWAQAQLIETDDAGNATGPEVGVSAGGDAIVVWSQSDGTRRNAWAVHYRAGSGWISPQLLESDDAGNVSGARVAVNAAGDAMAAWSLNDGTRANYWARRYTPAGGWEVVQPLEDVDVRVSSLELGLDARGNAIAVWLQGDDVSRFDVWARRFTPATGWGAPVGLENGAGGATESDIAVSAAGDAVAVWDQRDAARNRFVILANAYRDGVGWSGAVSIDAGEDGDADEAHIGIDDSGNALAVWAQVDNAGDELLWANRYIAGGGWRGAERLGAPGSGFAFEQEVALGANGQGLAVRRKQTGGGAIWANVFE